MTDYQLEYDGCRKAVEDALSACFTQEAPQRELLDAMRYSLLAGGKRIRPILALQFCKAACGDWKPALDYACAVEMLHTYSLIHDDLPCMDDDDLRRGRPTNHKVFGECSAVLAGDALQAAAFERVLTAPDLPADSRAAAAAVLARAAGAAEGICGGQYLDMSGEGHGLSLEDLTVIHTMKTAAPAMALTSRTASTISAATEKSCSCSVKCTPPVWHSPVASLWTLTPCAPSLRQATLPSISP